MMPFTKFGDAQDPEIVSREGHLQVEKELHQMGKTSARELTATQRVKISESLDESEN